MKPSKSNPISAIFALNNALKNFIHPPLPLSTRDQQKLLGILKDSFRSQLAASAIDPKSRGAATPSNLEATNVETRFHSPVDEHYREVLLKGPLLSASPTGIKDSTYRVNRFIQNPLALFEERALLGLPSARLAASVLKQHTTNVVNSRVVKGDPQWGIEAVLRVLAVYQNEQPQIHYKNGTLRRQVVRTLVQAGQAGNAADMVMKDWLLRVPVEDPAYEEKLIIRHALIGDIVDAMEEFQGYDAAATLFLQMVKQWKSKGGYMPDPSQRETPRWKQQAVLSTMFKHTTPLNPFQTKAKHFLFHYAQLSGKDVTSSASGLRHQVYLTCLPWVRSGIIRTKLILYYQDNPYPLYNLLMKYTAPSVGGNATNSSTRLLTFTQTCLEVILALVNHKDWEKANNMIIHMHRTLDGRYDTGLDPGMVYEIEAMMRSPRLSDLLTEYSRQVFQLLDDLSKRHLVEFWKQNLEGIAKGTVEAIH